MVPLSEEDEGIDETEEWDNLRPKNWEFDGVEGNGRFWEDGWLGEWVRSKVGTQWFGTVRDAIGEKRNGKMILVLQVRMERDKGNL